MKKKRVCVLVFGICVLCAAAGVLLARRSGGASREASVAALDASAAAAEEVVSDIAADDAVSGEQAGMITKKKKKLYLSQTLALAPSGETLVSCKSSKRAVATVSRKGLLHAVGTGKAKITVKTTKNGQNNTYIYRVTVKKRGMVYPSFSMMKGEHLDLQFSLEGETAVWSSNRPSVASVTKKGRVKAKKRGSAILTGVTKEGRTYRCLLKVTKRIKSVIYLTFDDGPNRYSTTKILNILKKEKVKATFFELKPAVKDFDLTERVIAEGHTLALHGYQHKYDIVYQSQKIYHENLDKLRNLFFQKYGVWCTVSRFPGGSSNMVSSYNPGIMTKLTQKLEGWGYHYFDWNVDSGDAGGAKTAADTYANFKNGLVKGRANVVLMHDYANNDKTIDALEKMIAYGRKNGYTFLPITASTDQVHHGVNN